MTEITEKPKPFRINYSEIIAGMLSRGRSQVEGTVLTLNAKGDVQAEVTAHVQEGETLSDATDRAAAELERVLARFPRQANGDTPAPTAAAAKKAAAIATSQTAGKAS